MRKLLVLVLAGFSICLFALAITLPVPAQPKKSEVPYEINFDSKTGLETRETSPDGKVKQTWFKLRFKVTLNNTKVTNIDGSEYKIAIYEDNKRVDEKDLPKPVLSEALSATLVVDAGGSMREHGRMDQARTAAAAFLQKLPPRADCGLILFDRAVRTRIEPVLDRDAVLGPINAVKPSNGTAYLDAALEGVKMLSHVKAGRDRALVLLTSGIDLNSKTTITDVVREAKKQNVRIYPIGIGEPGKLDNVNTALVLDHSGSMKPPASDNDTTPKIEALHQAGYSFVDSMSSVGRASIIPFSTIVGTPRPFLRKRDGTALKSTIRNLQPFGETALFDATYEGICVLEADGAPGKRAVVAMTDGIDNTSRRRMEEVIERAKEAKIPLYMLGFGRDSEIDHATMSQLANSTGGKYYHAKDKNALIDIFENLSIQLHGDGIDEESLKKIATDTGGQYYPAKDVSKLKLILEKVTQDIQTEAYEIDFRSHTQAATGTIGFISLKLIRRDSTTGQEIVPDVPGVEVAVQRRGLIIAEMNPFIYLVLLAVLGGLIALPGMLKRSPTA
jgi:Mg-chelatase subunit ChlD